MTTNPYSTNPPHSSLPPNSAGYRRPSYANVAAGTASNPTTSNFNTLAALGSHATSTASIPSQPQQQQHRQVTRQGSRSSIRSMEIDAQPRSERPVSSWGNTLEDRIDGNLGCRIHHEHPLCFTPSYLKRSRHVHRLHRAWNEHIAELHEHLRLNMPKQPSLSRSSSNANLGKMHSSHIHRGVVQDVIERIPPPMEEDRSHPLPNKWNEDDSMGGLEILADGSEVRFNGVCKTSDDAASVRSDHPMPKECGLYYFEVTIMSRAKEGLVGVGFSSRKVSLNRLPGWETDSWAYHGDDGCSFANTPSGKPYGPKFASQDVIGCGFNFRTGEAFFTKNGVYLGIAFSGIRCDQLYPSVGMKKPGEHLRVNFGRSPFVFDINQTMEQERQIVMRDISQADVSTLHRPIDESALIHNLIGQYLAHEGYVETAKEFAKEVQEQNQSKTGQPQSFPVPNSDDDIHAFNRQKIRRSILDGDIDKALKYTNTFYPHVLDDDKNKDIHFRLRCRKFIEMMRRYAELSPATTSPAAATTSASSISKHGRASTDNDRNGTREVGDTQMELDELLHREASRGPESTPSEDVDMDASQELPSKASALRQNDLLSQALAYGQELQSTFGGDVRPQIKKQLSDVFAIMAYTNPTESVVGSLLDPKGRVQIAEEVNGAILVSLGRPPFAALEKLCAQTEALLDETAAKTGGGPAFVNVQRDFLQP